MHVCVCVCLYSLFYMHTYTLHEGGKQTTHTYGCVCVIQIVFPHLQGATAQKRKKIVSFYQIRTHFILVICLK